MSEQRRRPDGKKPPRIRLPDGTWAVYMGETGKDQVRDKGRRRRAEKQPPQSKTPAEGYTEQGAFSDSANTKTSGAGTVLPGQRDAAASGAAERKAPGTAAQRRRPQGYAISESERREIERRRRAEYEARVRRAAAKGRNVAKAGESRRFYRVIADKIYMWWMAISIDVAQLVRGAVVAALILVFAMLQTTVFTNFRLFGAVPDLMLSLVIAVGVTEGDRWGSVTGLICAVIIECLGGYGLTLLPLLYVPVGFAAGILGTFYFRDSIPVRAIYSAGAGILKCIVTVICTVYAYGRVSVGFMFSEIVVPEYFSTLIMSVIPHVIAYFALKPFHKSRAERVY